MQLKADRPGPQVDTDNPPDYRHTDKVHGLVTVLMAQNRQTDATNCITIQLCDKRDSATMLNRG